MPCPAVDAPGSRPIHADAVALDRYVLRARHADAEAAARDHVAGAGREPPDGVVGAVAVGGAADETDAGLEIREVGAGRPGSIGADEVALDHRSGVRGVGHSDHLGARCHRDEVARGRRRAADARVLVLAQIDAAGARRERGRAGGVGPDVAAFDDRVLDQLVVVRDDRVGGSGAVDHEAADRHVVGADPQGGGAGSQAAAVELDRQHRVDRLRQCRGVRARAGLRVAVDGDWRCQVRQRRRRRDRVKPRARDVEGDRVRHRHRGVGVLDRLAKRAGSGVGGGGHRVSGGPEGVRREEAGEGRQKPHPPREGRHICLLGSGRVGRARLYLAHVREGYGTFRLLKQLAGRVCLSVSSSPTPLGVSLSRVGSVGPPRSDLPRLYQSHRNADLTPDLAGLPDSPRSRFGRSEVRAKAMRRELTALAIPGAPDGLYKYLYSYRTGR